jgi:hypothetical protein
MKRNGVILLLTAVVVSAQALSPAWVELGEGGRVIARIIVGSPGDCPSIQIDGQARPMPLRQPVPAGLRPACEAVVPTAAKSASVNGQSLPLPHRAPSRVVVFGDTGCRVKGDEIQACNDPELWPFAQVSAAAAEERADLVIHVGDYLYRESPCPADSRALCGGTPNGDNWESWNADFFTPAAKLLAASPWAFSRGNHEDCNRSWRGWFYYLDPRPFSGSCEAFSPPYTVTLGRFELVMLDSASVSANRLNAEQAALYARQLSSLHVAKGAWLADHHPFWGVRTDGADGKPAATSPTLEEAWDRAAPKGISLVLSGHVHLFELLSYDPPRPIQLVAGDGGTKLGEPIAESVKSLSIRGEMVIGGDSEHQFGYTLLTRRGSSWDLNLKNRARKSMVTCTLSPDAPRAKCSE